MSCAERCPQFADRLENLSNSVNNVMQVLSCLWYFCFSNNHLVLFCLFGLGLFSFYFLATFFAYFHPPLPFLPTLRTTHTTATARLWYIIKMLRGNFIWAHKSEHLLMQAGARINTLRQLGSLSKVLILHIAQQISVLEPRGCLLHLLEALASTSWKNWHVVLSTLH